MAPNFDTRHRPRRPPEWEALLEAIFKAAPTDETHALEWKWPVDLTDRLEVARSVPRTILAMANRPAQTAKEHFDGRGILVIGVEPNVTHPIAVLDSADLWPRYRRSIGRSW